MGQCTSKSPTSLTRKSGAPPLELADFLLVYQIGKGAFCKVFAAERKLDGRIMAIKVSSKEKLLAKKAVNHIIQERHLLEDISHPFICNLRYSFQDTLNVYMCLDLMTGGDLRVHLGSPIPEEATRLIIAEISLALEFLHNNNIVHRDIKPDNILLDEEGHAYLTDFNVAVQFQYGQPLKSAAGTEPYMAPELFSGGGGYYSSVDWWSMGVMMFEMIYADRPFRGKHKRQLISKGEYKFPSSKFGHISSACKTCISDFLQLKVDERLGCGLEGMRRFRDHPFFIAKRSRKAKKTSKGVEIPAVKIKPINWNKLLKKQIPPLYLPLAQKPSSSPAVQATGASSSSSPDKNKKKVAEKDVEGEKLKEKEKEEEYDHLIKIQQKELEVLSAETPDPAQQPPEYLALQDHFLYYDYNFPTKTTSLKNKRNKNSNYVDVSGVSNTSLVSMGASSYYDRKVDSNFSQRSLGVDSRNMQQQDLKKAPSIEIKPSRERDQKQSRGGAAAAGVTSHDGKENTSAGSLPGLNGSAPVPASNNSSGSKLRK